MHVYTYAWMRACLSNALWSDCKVLGPPPIDEKNLMCIHSVFAGPGICLPAKCCGTRSLR